MTTTELRILGTAVCVSCVHSECMNEKRLLGKQKRMNCMHARKMLHKTNTKTTLNNSFLSTLVLYRF